MGSKEVDLKEKYQRFGKMGESTYDTLFVAVDVQSKKRVISRVINLDVETNGVPSEFVREISILTSLDHPNIQKLLDYHVDQSKVELIFEYLPITISAYLQKRSMTNSLIQSYTYQLLCSLAYLHGHGVLHRGITTNSIFMSESGTIKLASFDNSRFFTIPVGKISPPSSFSYMNAPESVLMGGNYDASADIWSAGCVILAMVTQTHLFEADGEIDLVHKIFKSLGTPTKEEWPELYKTNSRIEIVEYPKKDLGELVPNCPPLLLDLLRQILQVVPSKRITAMKALSHEYFADVSSQIVESCHPAFD